MGYSKPWLSYEDQLAKLTERGLLVTDRAKALEYLERIGYYRLSGYWFPFRERSGPLVLLDGPGGRPRDRKRVETIALDDFKPGATFEQAVRLYVFDKQLRLLATDALERIEIALRVDISHTLGRLDAFAYLRPELFHESFSRRLDPKTGLTGHHAWLDKQAQLIVRSKEEFVRHNKAKYGLPLAVWVSCEVWDFGAMSKLYAGMRVQEQDAIAAKYGVCDGRVFASWLRSLNYLRNLCAHHSRLWNRNIVDQPKLPPASEVPWVVPFEQDAHARARCFLLLRIARHVLQRVNPGSKWPARLHEHLQYFPDLSHLGLGLTDLGAPLGWEAIWRG